ncbi:leucine--tRNA ligase [Mycetocola tolaasinivorans]|uniref:Leucine--tRNA ligase n=1 Tax=Mycetocola tolaasinivorans TaxID=76635 RepID=A0A3L7ABU0_9MICO|nr:leucine--tRNA ligase [Mycetocola tolaasinivorans]RLP76852.1 leucine--tRNA ligase [Mycetocola tolaasinivorans]
MSTNEPNIDEKYDFSAIQDRWLGIWDKLAPFNTADVPADAPRKYVLDMFPYPSGDLHMGHAEAFALGDVLARYWRGQGFSVLHPIGWDSFGLPAENAAIKRGIDPREWTYQNIEQQKTSFRRYATSFDWSREIHTSDPEYYRWNQWLFLEMFNKGLAYRKDSPVNWCPNDQTVLANEQVVDGRCERCGALVTKKKLNQWYFKITDYADRLVDDLSLLEEGWQSKVLSMQRNWVGRSNGADVTFEIEGRAEPITVYTTRPDTLFGATFMVVAADADLAAELVAEADAETRMKFQDYLEEVKKANDIERQATDREKTGLFSGRYAINPVNGEKLPIWISDYVLADYGHGAIMAVPAHDQRDLDFAKAFDLPVRIVVETEPVDGADAVVDPAESGIALPGAGKMINSGKFDGLTKAESIPAIIADLEERGLGHASKNYRLRDWLISRQRYWGTPIPIIHCGDCGEVPVPASELPVRLPESEGLDLQAKGASPLGAAEDWVNVPCPTCGKPAKRDSDTMDTFVDSSWYFLRFLSANSDEVAFDVNEAKKWAPVDHYVGGVEHAILHLLYARFITKVLHDLGYVDFVEPFTALLNQGMVLMDGSKMSKSKGNLVEFAGELDAYGADALRVTMAFASPPEDDIDWADVSPAGAAKFLARAWRISKDVTTPSGSIADDGDRALRRETHRFLADAPALIESYKFNVVVARLMELTNVTRRAIDSGPGAGDPAVREAAEVLATALNIFAPFAAEDMWSNLGFPAPVALVRWKDADPSLLVADSVTAVFQVNGKVRDRVDVAPDISAADLEAIALASDGVKRAIGEGQIVKVIVREPKLVNIAIKA